MPSLYPRFICAAVLFVTLLPLWCAASQRRWLLISEFALYSALPLFLRRHRSPGDGIDDPALDARVDAILQNMSLEEKVGQLVQYSAGSRLARERGAAITRT